MQQPRQYGSADDKDTCMTGLNGAPRAPLVATGIAHLDTLLGGGLQFGNTLLVLGAPGSGKTTLALQMAFHATAAEHNVLFLTGYSETQEKLFAHSRGFAFFQPEKVATRIQFGNLIDALRTGLDETEDVIVTTARAQGARLVILDGFQSMRRVLPDEPAPGHFLYSLGAKLALIGATTVVTMEGSVDGGDVAELGVADAIIELHRARDGSRQQRWLEIVKVRGTPALIGRHAFTLDSAGITAYPRFESTVTLREPVWTGARAAVGVADLDAMLSGGLSVGTSTLVSGTPGAGKSLLGLHFLVEGARLGEPGLLLGFMESAVQLREKARVFGLDLEAAERDGLIRLLIMPAFELDADRVASALREDVEGRGVRRLVIDSVVELERASAAQQRTVDFLAALVSYLRGRDISSYLTYDLATIVGAELSFADTPLSVLAENMLLLRQVEYRGHLRRLFSVLKMRFSAFDTTLRDYRIVEGRGIEILGPAPDAEGLLTGMARNIVLQQLPDAAS
jgi:circadian clock protein KaiC